MKIYKRGNQAIVHANDRYFTFEVYDWDQLINRDSLWHHLKGLVASLDAVDIDLNMLATTDPPMEGQEIWAAGVTYLKSKTARMEEAREAGGDLFYHKVYDADRPELFFKSARQRTVGHGDFVNIRHDSSWDVPEPELTLFVNSQGSIQGYTIGNVMSSRSIEGENPLYLPQAKVYDRCAALGPCLFVSDSPIAPDAQIYLQIHREGNLLYEDSVGIDRMKRTHQELVDYLFLECSFPQGVFLMTGTCLVPPTEFTLRKGDQISISIDHIGELINQVSQR
jgi:2-dehydro-3-deoxy-D-arabinonate dehydratase